MSNPLIFRIEIPALDNLLAYLRTADAANTSLLAAKVDALTSRLLASQTRLHGAIAGETKIGKD